MPGRNFTTSNGYRYGFNGKENDDEVKGIKGSQQDYGMRIYDPRLGKFLSVDPLTKKYPWYTPYQFAGNKPIEAVDLDGNEEFRTTSGQLLYTHSYNGVVYVVNDSYVDYKILTEQIVRIHNPEKGTVSYELQYVSSSINYSKIAEGALTKESGSYKNLINNAQKNDVGQATIDLHDLDAAIFGTVGASKCVNVTYARESSAYKTVTGNALPTGEFAEIWKTWNSTSEEQQLGVRKDLIMYGSPAAIDWANLGTAFTTEEIWAGKMIPGSPATYQGDPGHSFIFLGYTYDDNGAINGMNTWNQWNSKDSPYYHINKKDNDDLRGAIFYDQPKTEAK